MRYRDDDPLFYVRKHRSFRGLIVILLIIMIFSVSVVLVNAFINRQVQAVSRSVTIPSLPSSLEGFRILHISDLHGTIFGEGQEGISAAIKNLRYDIVVLTGDMLGSDGNFDGLISLLDLLGDKVPVFLIAGDEDPSPIPSTAHLSNQTKAEYVLAAETRGAVYLDVPYQLTVGKTVLWLCPESVYSTDIASTRHSMDYNLDLLEKSPETEDTKAAKRALVYWIDRLNRTEEALIAMKSADTKICVTHIPFTAANISDLMYAEGRDLRNNATPVSLVLAGHYNAGQCQLPVFGPVFIPADVGIYPEDRWFPGSKGLSGLITIRGITQHISPGLGSALVYSPFKWRFFNSPSVTVLSLTSKLVSE
ncbi:MAG: metallophosphoesterase [Clostridia bacterium]|nr:metallophosphoesterase [Clostridia bacterium]MBQ4434901.1 metallophosphoesterase [Clostridia bacterium]